MADEPITPKADSMIERCYRAFCLDYHSLGCTYEGCETHAGLCEHPQRDRVHAVLATLRTPTEAMLDGAHLQSDWDYPAGGDEHMTALWQAMIDKAGE